MTKEQKEFTKYFTAPIPANVIFSEELTYKDKLVYMMIAELSYRDGKCTASNPYFGKLTETTDRNVRHSINKLARLRYIIVEVKNGKDRTITLPEIQGATEYQQSYKKEKDNRRIPDFKDYIEHMRENYNELSFPPALFSSNYRKDYLVQINNGYLCEKSTSIKVPFDTSNRLWKLMWGNQNKLFELIETSKAS